MDNKKNVRFSGMGIYMIIVIIAAMFIMYVARMNTGTSNYTYNELVNDISKGKIESVSIRQNAEVPTGVVTVKVSGEQSVKSVYVSDVKDVEELLLDKNIEYTLKRCCKTECYAYNYTSIWLKPSCYCIHYDDVYKTGWWRWQCQDDEFWKEQGQNDKQC